jgi:hypothetical protein
MVYKQFKVEKLLHKQEYSALSLGDYKTSLGELIHHKFAPVDIEKLAEHRIDLGKFHQISWTGSRTTNLFVSIDDEFFLAKANLNSFFFDIEALDAIQKYHANWNEITYRSQYVEEKIAVPREGLNIPVKDFTTHPVSRFLFGEQTEAYADWLRTAGIPAFPILLPNFSLTSRYEDDFVRPLIMRCTDNWSGIITANADLHTDYGYRGYAKRYSGEVEPIESFSRNRLDNIAKFFPLENRTYSLPELEKLFTGSTYEDLFNPLLRNVRNGGSNLPANFTTWE